MGLLLCVCEFGLFTVHSHNFMIMITNHTKKDSCTFLGENGNARMHSCIVIMYGTFIIIPYC